MGTAEAPIPAGEPIPLNDLSHVEAVLAEMWRVAAESAAGEADNGKPLVRVSLANVIAVTDMERTGTLSETLDRLSLHRPARVLIAGIDPRLGEAPIQGYVRAVCHRPAPDTPQICCEHVHLQLGPPSLKLLPGVVASLLEADLPSLLWWDAAWGGRAATLARLGREVDTIVIDSELAGPTAALQTVLGDLPGGVHDLAWARLTPWRRHLAAVFDDPLTLGLLSSLRAVEIENLAPARPSPPAQALLYHGWLAGQLGWEIEAPLERSSTGWSGTARSRQGRVRLSVKLRGEPRDPAVEPAGAELVGVRLEAAEDGLITVTSLPGSSSFEIRVQQREACPLPQRLARTGQGPEEIIGGALESPSREDAVYARALAQAVALAGSVSQGPAGRKAEGEQGGSI